MTRTCVAFLLALTLLGCSDDDADGTCVGEPGVEIECEDVGDVVPDR